MSTMQQSKKHPPVSVWLPTKQIPAILFFFFYYSNILWAEMKPYNTCLILHLDPAQSSLDAMTSLCQHTDEHTESR